MFTSGPFPNSEDMAEDAIGKAGLYFDELNKIRVLEPETAVQTNDLKDACKDFLESKINIDVAIDVCMPENSIMQNGLVHRVRKKWNH